MENEFCGFAKYDVRRVTKGCLNVLKAIKELRDKERKRWIRRRAARYILNRRFFSKITLGIIPRAHHTYFKLKAEDEFYNKRGRAGLTQTQRNDWLCQIQEENVSRILKMAMSTSDDCVYLSTESVRHVDL